MSHSVLIVEDEQNIVTSLDFLMRQAGFEVAIARDGPTAMAAVELRRPDLILLDVMLPHTDGYQVCAAIRARPELNGVRILMLSAKGRDVDRDKGLTAGADDYITKPFSNNDLVERVKLLLDGEAGAPMDLPDA
jgi:DNA-binding response OmpR family regulator